MDEKRNQGVDDFAPARIWVFVKEENGGGAYQAFAVERDPVDSFFWRAARTIQRDAFRLRLTCATLVFSPTKIELVDTGHRVHTPQHFLQTDFLFAHDTVAKLTLPSLKK